jgi:predicted NBD/HSP70 family sugar kinase
VYGLKHQKEKRSMEHFAGLDVSVNETSVCIVDETGRIVREVKVASEPDALLQVLKNSTYRFRQPVEATQALNRSVGVSNYRHVDRGATGQRHHRADAGDRRSG